MKTIIVLVFLFFFQINYSQIIFKAIISEDIKEVERLANKRENLDTISSEYGTPLMAAVFIENTEIIELLIQKGADINEEVSIWFFNDYKRRDEEKSGKSMRRGYSSAIDLAVEKENLDVVKLLRNNSAMLNSRLLLKSVKNDDLLMLKYLVNEGLMELVESDDVSKSIVTAYLNNNLELSDYVISNRTENKCITHALIHFINTAKDNFLYYLNSNFSMHDYFNSAEFDDVINSILFKDNQVLLDFLTEQNIILNRKHKAYDYFMAVAENDNIEMFDFLISQGLSFDDDSRIPGELFKYSIENNKAKTLSYFFKKDLKNKININLTPKSGGNYCNFAAKNDFSDICKTLITNGIKQNLLDTAGYTSLDYAIINENKNLTKFLNEYKGLTSFNVLKQSNKDGYILYYDGTYVCERKESLYYADIKFNNDFNCWEYFKFRNDSSLYFKGFYKDDNLTVNDSTFIYYLSDSSIYMIEKYENDSLLSRFCPNIDYIEDSRIFVYVDDMPEFPGGQLALRRWIVDNLTYPLVARESSIQGTVYLRFEVMKNGKIGKIELQKGVDPLMDLEAVELIKKLPKFKPGSYKGIPVNVWYSVPVTFKLN